jgi:hypothetical protein
LYVFVLAPRLVFFRVHVFHQFTILIE